jgi:SPW repeat
MPARPWQDRANLALGSWMFISPWMLGYGGGAATNAFLFGAGIAAFALLAPYVPRPCEIINTLSGVWLVISPFVLGFTAIAAIALHTVVVGILVAALALWAMFGEARNYRRA